MILWFCAVLCGWDLFSRMYEPLKFALVGASGLEPLTLAVSRRYSTN